jgi:glycosyltransferase involved in cell wall biosynthesis
LRIVHIANFFASERGYIEYYLAKKQQDNGNEVSVISSDRYPSGDKRPDIDGIACKIEGGLKVYRLPSSIVLSDNPFISIRSLKKCLADLSPDVVHVHSALSPIGFASAFSARSVGYKTVANVVSGISPVLFRYPKIIKTFSNDLIFKRINAYSACSKAIVRFLVGKLDIPCTKVNLIPLGADTSLFRPDQQAKIANKTLLGISHEDVVAIYTGKILPEKKIHDLLIATKSVMKQIKGFKVLLVGDGPASYLEYLNTLVDELKIRKNVIMIKMVHRTKLANYYNAADFAVWPGTFSISIVEAMSSGLPIVIAESEWTEHNLDYQNGYSFKAGDIDRLSTILVELSSNEALRELMSIRSRKLVEDKLSWDKIADKYNQVYAQIINQC